MHGPGARALRGPLRTPSLARWCPSRPPQGDGTEARLLQLILHLLQTGIDAVVVDARRTGHADAADHGIANLDRLAAEMAMTFGSVTCWWTTEVGSCSFLA